MKFIPLNESKAKARLLLQIVNGSKISYILHGSLMSIIDHGFEMMQYNDR